jgi:hypothetical protein
MLRCIACDRAMSDITKDLCGTCESVAMSLVPKSLMKGTLLWEDQTVQPEFTQQSTATLLFHWTQQLDTVGVPSATKMSPHEDSLCGAHIPDGVCIATVATNLSALSRMV